MYRDAYTADSKRLKIKIEHDYIRSNNKTIKAVPI